MFKTKLACAMLAFFAITPCCAETPQRLTLVRPESLGIDASRLAPIDRAVQKALQQKRMPGCVVAIGHRGKLILLRAYGHRQLMPEKLAMRTDTVFDMASLTKPIATATSVMMLLERGDVRIRDRVASYLPAFGNKGKEKITVHQLLTHQGGLIPDNSLKDYLDGPEKARQRVFDLPLWKPVGEQFAYTDVGFIVLAELVRQQSGKDIHAFTQANLFRPLGMKETGFNPPALLRQRAATTEQREGRWMQGEVHDPRAYQLRGVAGHAGLFSTAEDLAVYAQMMLNRGEYQGVRVLSPRAVDIMTASYSTSGGTRGLGWDKLSRYSSNRGELMSPRAFGHGGFTGTAMWVDPTLDMFVIFLSNRVHPNGKGSVNSLAGRIGTIAAAAVTSRNTHAAPHRTNAVQTGIDVLQRSRFKALQGKRVGLITNQTGIARNGKSTANILHAAKEVNLVALFSPEHGLEGKLDIPRIGNTQDTSTGLKVVSLYGKSRRPSAEALARIDTIVFDIQDIGTRYYTYISTMGYAMEEAAKHGKEFVVLDRPNPINGVDVDGPVLDSGSESFVGYHTIPVRHGMTVGELAQMFRAEKNLPLKLTVVRVEGWRRHRYQDDNDLVWINPSPNMRNLNQALLYPGIGLLETTNLSVGRGTDTPFELLGAPWLDGRKLAQKLNQRGLAGIRFVPTAFTPESSVYKDIRCQGIQILITDRSQLQPLDVGMAIATTLRDTFPDWKLDRYHRLLANQRVLGALKAGKSAQELRAAFTPRLNEFRARRQKHLLY